MPLNDATTLSSLLFGTALGLTTCLGFWWLPDLASAGVRFSNYVLCFFGFRSRFVGGFSWLMVVVFWVTFFYFFFGFQIWIFGGFSFEWSVVVGGNFCGCFLNGWCFDGCFLNGWWWFGGWCCFGGCLFFRYGVLGGGWWCFVHLLSFEKYEKKKKKKNHFMMKHAIDSQTR